MKFEKIYKATTPEGEVSHELCEDEVNDWIEARAEYDTSYSKGLYEIKTFLRPYYTH